MSSPNAIVLVVGVVACAASLVAAVLAHSHAQHARHLSPGASDASGAPEKVPRPTAAPSTCNAKCPPRIHNLMDAPTRDDRVCVDGTMEFRDSCLAECNGHASWREGSCARGKPFEDVCVMCPSTKDPVCVDGTLSYSNTCQAKCAGHTTWTRGMCGGR